MNESMAITEAAVAWVLDCHDESGTWPSAEDLAWWLATRRREQWEPHRPVPIVAEGRQIAHCDVCGRPLARLLGDRTRSIPTEWIHVE